MFDALRQGRLPGAQPLTPETPLSLALLIRFWEDLAQKNSPRGELARGLVARLRAVPELTRPIDDITLLDQHGGLVDALMSAVFPSVFWDQAYMGALIPFTLRSVYGTRALDSIMGPDGVLHECGTAIAEACQDPLPGRLLERTVPVEARLGEVAAPRGAEDLEGRVRKIQKSECRPTTPGVIDPGPGSARDHGGA